MHSSFWTAAPAAPPDDCNACAQCPVDDWLAPCSAPDCTIPQSSECTDKCVVVTHHSGPADAPCCDAAPCSMPCDGFDSNWVCGDADHCSQFTEDLKGFSQQMQALVDHAAPFYDFNPCFAPLPDNMHIHQLPPAFTAFSLPTPSSTTSSSYQNSPSPLLIQHQQQQSDLACLWSDCDAVLPSSGDLFDHLNMLHIPGSSHPHQHQQQQQQDQLACLWSDCHALLPSTGDLSAHLTSLHIPATGAPDHASHPHSHSHPPSPRQSELACLWSDCHAVFPSTGDLFSHLTSQHVPSPAPTSCLWDDCGVFPDLSAIPGPSISPGPGVVSQLLATHLLHDHLGLQRPPSSSLQPSPGPTSTRASPSSEEDSASPAPASATVAVPDAHAQAHPCLWAECDEVFSSCDSLTAHIASAHVGTGKAQYECRWRGCARTGAAPFASKQKILRHMQSHTGHRPFQCTVCEQNFSEAATLQQHMRRHTHEKPYRCDFPGCGKAFAITGALTIHKRVHNGERPFKCMHCDRAFSESSNLSKHLRTHTGARPYPCPEPGCDKRFARPDQVARHANVHRKAKPVE